MKKNPNQMVGIFLLRPSGGNGYVSQHLQHISTNVLLQQISHHLLRDIRLRQHGAEIVNGEMVGFEWLRRAADDRFRDINRDFLR